MNRITVYTTTYNRAYTLHKGYKALCNQTYKDFEWLIVDDGSTDNTKELVDSWIKENIISIRYIYQENQGMNNARNTAVQNIETELCICVDSDDYLTDDALKKIINLWDSRQDDKYVGIIALDCFESGKIVGNRFPDNLKEATFFELCEKYKIYGDKKMAYLTALCKKYPNPSFPGEKHYPQRYQYYKLDEEGPCLLLNEPICVVEYLEDGLTASRYKKYYNNPVGHAAYRRFLMQYDPRLKNVVRQSIHYVALSLIADKKLGIAKSERPIITFLVSPLGIAWYLRILYNNRHAK